MVDEEHEKVDDSVPLGVSQGGTRPQTAERRGKDEMKDETSMPDEQDSGSTLTDKLRNEPWMVSTLVFGVIVAIFLVSSLVGPTGNAITGSVVSENVAGQALLDFANSQGANAELVGVADAGEFYEVTLLLNGQEAPLMVTKDGKYFLSGSLVPLITKLDSETEQSSDSPKSDKPKVELFVMTHCPYGTQAEKGIIPAIKALGDTVDAKIRFVHYFMHDPEETETPRQVCIREEQSELWYDYLGCFLKEGDSSSCLREANINMAKLNTCINTGKADEYYAEDSTLSESYGVQGSPTLIINGEQSNAGRDSASYLAGICGAFNDSPEECALELSSASPSPGFGYSTTGSATSAQC